MWCIFFLDPCRFESASSCFCEPVRLGFARGHTFVLVWFVGLKTAVTAQTFSLPSCYSIFSRYDAYTTALDSEKYACRPIGMQLTQAYPWGASSGNDYGDAGGVRFSGLDDVKIHILDL